MHVNLVPSCFRLSVIFVLIWLASQVQECGAVTVTHDHLLRVVQVDNADGTLTNYTYDDNGNRLSRVRIDNRRTINVTLDPSASGTVTGDGQKIVGDTASLSASPAGGFIFGGWFENGVSIGTNPALTFTVSSSRNIVARFLPLIPEIAIEDPSTTPATDLLDGGSSLSFGSQPLQSSSSKTLTIRNTGIAPLTELLATVDGTAGAEFAVSGLPTTLAAGSIATLIIQFSPSAMGARSAALHIASNDANENPFDINLTGAGLNTAPTISSIADTATTTGTATAAIPFTIGDTETAASALTLSGSSSNTTVVPNGAIAFGGSGVNRTVSVTPASGQIGTANITVTVSDGVLSASKSFVVTVNGTSPQIAGNLDSAFNPSIPGGASSVYSMAVQPDGKILIVGSFTSVGGLPRTNIARLNPDGRVDPTFAPGSGADHLIYCVAIQTDGRILIGGRFANFNGQARSRIARLNTDGTVDATFNPGSGASDQVYGIAVQPDAKILLCGWFTSVNGQSRTRIARLNTEGSVDTTFNPGSGANSDVFAIALQPDGKVLLGGRFTTVNGLPRKGIARLNPNGSVEDISTFNPGTGINNYPLAIMVQADGKILVGGDFTAVNGLPRAHIARLLPNGAVEDAAAFNIGSGVNDLVLSLALQTDGRIIVGGRFTSVDGQPRTNIARLQMDGAVETGASFNAGSGPNNNVFGVLVQPDGKILMGGSFTAVNGQSRYYMARLGNDATTESLTIPDTTRVTWLRGGAGPEVEQVAFDLSTDGGGTWSPVGLGTRIAGGWECASLNLPSNGKIRAQGRTVGGQNNGSSGVMELVQQFHGLPVPPSIFSDFFNRPDSPDVNNGWNHIAGQNSASRIELLNQEIINTSTQGGGYAGIIRPLTFLPITHLSILFKETNGYGGFGKRYDHTIAILSDGTPASGYRLEISRSDMHAQNSSITFFDGAIQVARFVSPIQFGTDVLLEATFRPDGSVTGKVTSDGNSADFTFGSHTIQSHGYLLGIWLAAPDNRVGGIIFPRADNLAVNSYATATTLFADNFDDDSRDPLKWTATGNTVSETGQMMRVEATVTNRSGTLVSSPFVVNSRGLISISRRVKVHYANDRFDGLMNVQIGTLQPFAIHYANYGYSSSTEVARRDFFLTRNDGNCHTVAGAPNTSTAIPAVWDTWFNEHLTYDPETGIAEYFINNLSQKTFNVGILPPSPDPSMTLSFGVWGWWTGHTQWFDDLMVVQAPIDATRYERWEVSHFGEQANNVSMAGYAANPDGDAMVNLMEFAFGTPPMSSTSGLITLDGNGIAQRGRETTWVQNIANGVDFRALYGRRKDYLAARLTYTVQFSADLITWQSSTATPTVIADDGEIEAVTVPYPFFINGKKARFFRVSVSVP